MSTTIAPAANVESKPQASFNEIPTVHAEYALRNAKVNTWPFRHAVVRPIFPAWYYQDLTSLFPADDAFVQLNKYHPDRGAVFLTDRGDGTDDLGRLPEPQRAFWGDFARSFGSDRFRAALLDRIGGESYVDRYLSRSRALIHLSLDRCGYQIAPHTDVAKKIVTAVFYLPDVGDFTNEPYGTSVLVQKPGAEEMNPQDWNRYDIAYTAPFIANSLFTFAVGTNSWHAVKPVDKPTRRRSIQYFVFLNE
jgi:hypothetical protein